MFSVTTPNEHRFKDYVYVYELNTRYSFYDVL